MLFLWPVLFFFFATMHATRKVLASGLIFFHSWTPHEMLGPEGWDPEFSMELFFLHWALDAHLMRPPHLYGHRGERRKFPIGTFGTMKHPCSMTNDHLSEAEADEEGFGHVELFQASSPQDLVVDDGDLNIATDLTHAGAATGATPSSVLQMDGLTGPKVANELYVITDETSTEQLHDPNSAAAAAQSPHRAKKFPIGTFGMVKQCWSQYLLLV